MEHVSANYHLVTYKKLIDTGVVQQKFVDEKGNEIAPTITSEKSDKGTTVTVATPPNEITYNGQTYLLQTEKIPNSLVIEKGINPVTFSYKLQVVTDKGTPERLEVPEYNEPVSMKGDPLIFEVPEYNGSISMKGDPLTLEVPEYNGPINQVGEPEVQPELPKLVLNNEQTNSQTKVQKPVETVNSSKQTLPKTGSSYNGVYYTISASILSLFGVLSLNFKKKDMK